MREETAVQKENQEAAKKEHHDRYFNIDGSKKVTRREGFPDLPENMDDMRQCNEGGCKFLLDDSEDNKSVVLDVQVGVLMLGVYLWAQGSRSKDTGCKGWGIRVGGGLYGLSLRL